MKTRIVQNEQWEESVFLGGVTFDISIWVDGYASQRYRTRR